MAKKKLASTGSVDASVLRRSGRETSTRKQTTSSPVSSTKTERIKKHTSPSSSPVKNKLERTETQMGPSPLRRSDRGKKLVEIPKSPNLKSTKEKTANNSKQCSEDVDEVKKSEKQNSDDGGRKRKRFTAIQYKAFFKPQRIRIQSDDDENPEVKDKSPQANTSRTEDVDKELKAQSGVRVQGGPDKDGETVVENGVRVQGGPDKDGETVVEGRVIDLDQIEHGDFPQTKSIDGKPIESGDVEKKNGGNVSPFNGNIVSSDNHMVHTSSSYRVEPDLENQQESDTCHKVAETHKAAGIMENAENNDVSSSRFVEFWVPVQISNVQLEQYCATLLSNEMALSSSSKSDTLGALNNIYIANRKCCNHPYIVNNKLEESLMKYKAQSTALDVDVKASGKLQFLDHVLPVIQKQQLKVLILFQHTSGTLEGCLSLGQILVGYFDQRYGQNSFVHVDGFGKLSSKKQGAINMFNKEPDRFIFLLESRSCHQSIKLSVDIIIIFDSELNPLNDIKSLQKLSIDSQSEQIMIFRLYTSSTLEEKILKLAEINIAIDIRSQNLRCHYDALLTWGASDLFDKLTKFHSQSVSNFSSEESLLKDVVEEFLYIISCKCKSSETTSKSSIIRAKNCGIYGKSILSHCEMKTYLKDGDQPYRFWKKLLEGRSPLWKFVSELTPRQRKRPSFFCDLPLRGVRTRRKTVNICSTVEPGKLNTVTVGEAGGVNEGVPVANDESQSSSADWYWSAAVVDKPTVSKLCNILKFSDYVKMIVERFLEFVLENFCVTAGKEYTSTLHAFMISLCWIGSSLGESQIDRSESFALAKKHLNFSCIEEEADIVYNKLKAVEEIFLQKTKILDCLKDSIPAAEEVRPEITKSQHSHSVDAFENHESCENVSKKGEEEFEKIKRIWDDKRASLELEYKLNKSVIHVLWSKNLALRAEKLLILERNFVNNLEEHERLKATMLAAKGQVAAENGSHSGNPEVAPALPEKPIEVQSLDEPVCEGANDIESTGSHTSGKEAVDVTVCSEQIGEVPVQQVDDEMEVDVAEKVDFSHENANGGAGSPDVSHAVEDPVIERNETGANEVVPNVDSGDLESPAGDYNKETDEDGIVGLNSSHVVEDRQENIDDVAPEVECVEMGMLAGTNAVEDHNETDANVMVQHVNSGDLEASAGDYNKESDEHGIVDLDTSHVVEDRQENVDDVAPEVECVEMGMPAGTYVVEDHNEIDVIDMVPHVDSGDMEMRAGNYNKENSEDGTVGLDTSHIVEDHHVVVDDVTLEVECAEMGMPAGISETEDIEDGEIRSDFGDNHKETSPNDVLPHAESAEMEMPAVTRDKEDNEDGGPGTPNVADDHNETRSKDLLPRVEFADMAIPAGNEENAEDNIIIPDGLHANEAHNGSSGSDGNDPVCAALSQAKTPSVQQVSSLASDQLEPIMPVIQNEPHQLEQLPDSGLQDEEINGGDLEPSGASQLDQMILDVEPEFPSSPDPMVAEDPSGMLPPNTENLEDNLAAAVETGHEEHQPSVAIAPPVNAFNMFDNITNRVSSQMPTQTDPLQAEVERLNIVKANVTKFYQEMKQKLSCDCEKEISEMIVQIRLKYEAKHVEADAAFNKKKMELETNIDKVNMNKVLADAFRSKCQDLASSGNTGMQQVSRAVMQQMCRFSPGQSSGNQQPPQPPPSLPQPPAVPPLQPPLTRPRPPLQVVHQSAALFSSRASPVVNQVTSSTPPTTSRTPPIINHSTPSTTPTTTRPRPPSNPITTSSAPTTSRPPPIVSHTTPSTTPTTTRPLPTSTTITPSSTPTSSRLPHGFNTINPSTLPNRSPLSIAQIDMSAANLRISTETGGQSPHMRPLVSSETRPSTPQTRPIVGSELRATGPYPRSSVSSEVRAMAPHLRSATPRTFRSTPSVSPDLGTHRRTLLGQNVISGPSQPNMIPPNSTTSPPSLTPLPSEDVILLPQSPSPPSSEQTPLLAHDLVCLSDDD